MGVLIRGPLAKGVLSGKSDRSSVFDDTVRSIWNEGSAGRADFERRMDGLEKLLKSLPRESLAETAIRFTASHAAAPVSIPGQSPPSRPEKTQGGRMVVYARAA
jgi:aryl-alcohol dehydrogenase-like predicted oxidoreductase